MQRIKDIIKRYKWQGIGLLHFICSFVYTKGIFQGADTLPCDYMVPLRDYWITRNGEHILHIILSRILAFVLIMGIWSLIGVFFEKGKLKTHHRILFLATFLPLGIVTLILSREFFSYEYDNVITLSCALHNLPFYWHNIWTSVYYGACLIIFPSVYFMQVFQTFLLCVVFLYIFYESEKHFPKTKLSYCIFLLLLFPEMRLIMAVPYRNNLYTILCLFLIPFMLFRLYDFLKADKNRASDPGKCRKLEIKFVLCMPLLAFLSTWRTEGILFGIIFLGMILCVFTKGLRAWKNNWKKIVLLFLVFVVSFELFGAPQKIGDKKYFGKDYLIVSTLSTIYTILNEPDANLSYAGAKQDLEAIGRAIPLEGIQMYATDSIHMYNSMEGRYINQTCLTDEESKAFLAGVVRLVLHNPSGYIKCQMNNLFQSVGSRYRMNAGEFTHEKNWLDPEIALAGYYSQIEAGTAEKYQTRFALRMDQSAIRIALRDKINDFCYIYDSLLKVPLDALHQFGIVFMLLFCLIGFWLGRKRSKILNSSERYFWICYSVIGIAVLLEFAGVAASAPEARPQYYFPAIYSIYILDLFYLIARKNEHMALREKEIS